MDQNHTAMGLDKYATHLPLLCKCFALTLPNNGAILELGCGGYSTLILHNLCYATERLLYSIESDKAWLDKFTWMENHFHKLIHCDMGGGKYPVPQDKFDIVFIDHISPKGRIADGIALKDSARLVVIHDWDCPSSGYSKLAEYYKYLFVDTTNSPNTCVLSNEIDVRHWRLA